MGSTLKLRGLLGALAAVGVVGVAVAQPQAPTATPPQDTVELGARREVSLTPEQMQVEAKSFLPGMDRGAATVRKQLADARQRRDVVRVLCLNDKLNQIDLAIRTANDRMEVLSAAATRQDADGTKHEFTVVQVLRERVETLVKEANQCIGEETGFIGDSQLTVDIDPSIPDEDPSDFPDDPLVSTPPTVSSPTL